MKNHFLDPPHLSHPPRANATPSSPKKEVVVHISYMMKKWLHLTFDVRLDQVEQVRRDASRVEMHIV